MRQISTSLENVLDMLDYDYYDDSGYEKIAEMLDEYLSDEDIENYSQKQRREPSYYGADVNYKTTKESLLRFRDKFCPNYKP